MRWTNRLRLLAVTGLGSGLIPFAPGTWGTLVGTLWFIVAVQFSEPWATLLLAAVIVAACVATVALGDWAEKYLGGKDPQRVVLDEVAGILLTLLLFRDGVWWLALLWAFTLFRILDIVKLPPARQAEKLPQGWGVLIDDLISACYAAAILWGVRWLAPSLFGLA